MSINPLFLPGRNGRVFFLKIMLANFVFMIYIEYVSDERNKNEVREMKNLEIGKNYGEIFGLTGNRQMIFNGGISWTAKEGEREMTMDSQKTTDNAIEYINRPSHTMRA
mgnify:CR=1 FL=1